MILPKTFRHVGLPRVSGPLMGRIVAPTFHHSWFRTLQLAKNAPLSIRPSLPTLRSTAPSSTPTIPAPTERFSIVNFYWLTPVADAEATTEAHRQYLADKDIRGRVYISPQGINAQYSGPADQADAYAQWVKAQPGFEGVVHSADPVDTHMFPRLRLKCKKSLISMRGGHNQYEITNPEARATALEPDQWKRMIADAKQVIRRDRGEGAGEGGASTSGRADAKDYVILDLRNDYEWDAGHFEGSDRPVEDEFAQTPTDGSLPAYLEGTDPESTKVMMYCTGGIRCDIYSAYLKAKGYKNLFTLERGVANYFRTEGGEHWKGSMFVFDARMAVSPAAELIAGTDLPAAVPCQLCNNAEAKVPHVNCANVDCNKLFIACEACKEALQGCCCAGCIAAPRLLRPAKFQGAYGTWVDYVQEGDRPLVDARMAAGRTRRRTVTPPSGPVDVQAQATRAATLESAETVEVEAAAAVSA